MRRSKKLLFVVVFALLIILILINSTYATVVLTLETDTDADVVGQDTGLLAVSQNTTNFNSTTNTADLSVSATNQITVKIDQIDITVNKNVESTKSVSPGATDSVSFSDADCTATIVIEYDTGSISQRIEQPIICQ